MALKRINKASCFGERWMWMLYVSLMKKLQCVCVCLMKLHVQCVCEIDTSSTLIVQIL